MPVLQRLRAETGTAMIVIEHDVYVVRSVSDRLACMHLGEVIADGPPDEVLARPDVIASYLGDDASAPARSGCSVVGAGPTSGATPSGALRRWQPSGFRPCMESDPRP